MQLIPWVQEHLPLVRTDMHLATPLEHDAVNAQEFIVLSFMVLIALLLLRSLRRALE
jgi:hypothetical protein